jgi:hypothetical protein
MELTFHQFDMFSYKSINRKSFPTLDFQLPTLLFSLMVKSTTVGNSIQQGQLQASADPVPSRLVICVGLWAKLVGTWNKFIVISTVMIHHHISLNETVLNAVLLTSNKVQVWINFNITSSEDLSLEHSASLQLYTCIHSVFCHSKSAKNWTLSTK